MQCYLERCGASAGTSALKPTMATPLPMSRGLLGMFRNFYEFDVGEVVGLVSCDTAAIDVYWGGLVCSIELTRAETLVLTVVDRHSQSSAAGLSTQYSVETTNAQPLCLLLGNRNLDC